MRTNPPPPAFGYTVETNGTDKKSLDLTIVYWPAPPAAPGQPAPLPIMQGLFSLDATVKLTLKETAGVVPRAVAPNFGLPPIQKHAASAYVPPGPVPYDPSQNGYVMHFPELSGLAHYVANVLRNSGVDPRNPAGLSKLELKPVKVRPWVERWGSEVEATGSITLNLKFELGAAPPAVLPPVLVHPPGCADGV